MSQRSREEREKALRPIASLIGKSEKAQRKLEPGMWQYAMLRDNLKALRVASELMVGEANDPSRYAREDLREALKALAVMLVRSEKARLKFPPGTAQHTLLVNRIEALRIARESVDDALDACASLQTSDQGTEAHFSSDSRMNAATSMP